MFYVASYEFSFERLLVFANYTETMTTDKQLIHFSMKGWSSFLFHLYSPLSTWTLKRSQKRG